MKLFQRLAPIRVWLLSSSILAVLVWTPAAFAQDAKTVSPAQDTGVEEKVTRLDAIVVTAMRESLQAAAQIKRDKDQVVDSIVAEDIGKFPDNTLADSLQRVTGVQVSRSNNETNGVVIRGLPNVITTLNGRQIFTAAGRGLAFQDLPAEAIARVDVYKSSSAQLLEGGIAGLVDVVLHRPFDFEGRQVAGALRLTHSEIAGKTDPSLNFLISDRWDTDVGEFGALFNVSHYEQDYVYPISFNDVQNPFTTADGQTIRLQNTVGALYTAGFRERPQANASFQWKPTEDLELYADLLRTEYDSTFQTNFFFSALGTATAVEDLVVHPDSVPNGCTTISGARQCGLVSGTFINPFTASSTQAIEQHTDTSQFAIGAKWDNTPLRLSTDLAYTDSEFRNDAFIVDTSLPGQTVRVATNVDDHTSFSLDSNDQLDPTKYVFEGLFNTFDFSQGSEIDWRGDLEYDLGGAIVQQLRVGLRYADREATAGGGELRSIPPPAPGIQVVSVFPGFFALSPDELPFLPVSPWNSGDLSFLLNNKDAIRAFYGVPAGNVPIDPTRGFEAAETTYTAYGEVVYGFDAGAVPIDGLLGVRVIKTERDLESVSVTDGVQMPVSSATSDTDYLPNFSLRAGLTDTLQARLSASKTITRPDFGLLNPSLSLNPGTINRLGSGAGGNPDLAPIRSTNYDATLEWYFSKAGSASIAVFYRDIDGFIQTFSSVETIDGLDFNISRPQSAGAGHLSGAEVAYQQFYDGLPGFWGGLGLQVNYTYIDGAARTPAGIGGPVTTTALGQVARHNYNVVLMYEKYNVSARLALNHRGEYIDGFSVGGVQTPQTNNVRAQDHLDFSLTCALNEWVVLTFNATNLTKEKFQSFFGDPILPHDYRYEDRTYAVGVRLRF